MVTEAAVRKRTDNIDVGCRTQGSFVSVLTKPFVATVFRVCVSMCVCVCVCVCDPQDAPSKACERHYKALAVCVLLLFWSRFTSVFFT